MKLTVNMGPGGPTYVGATPDYLASKGVDAATIGAAIKAAARDTIARAADGYRAKLAEAPTLKVATEYWVKSQIAADPEGAAAEEMALTEREATARGLTTEEHLAAISAKAAAFRRLALLVGTLEAEAVAALNAVADGAADIEAQVKGVLEAAEVEAETAFAEAMAELANLATPAPTT